jgi:pyruvate/2-oxoacid:ferredoxin oxidoreductase beta subunit
MSPLDTAADAVINLFTPQKKVRPMPANAQQIEQSFAEMQEAIRPYVRQVALASPQQRAEKAIEAIENDGVVTLDDLRKVLAEDDAEHKRLVESVEALELELQSRTAPLYEEIKALIASRAIVRETVMQHTAMLKAPFKKD